MGETYQVRNRDLYVEDMGHHSSPALLYLHGGPGSGCYDFVTHQGQRLAEHMRLVAVDQRGVLRSAPIEDDEPFGLEDLIEDCESLRAQLKIDHWTVLGHSFGGYVALKYAMSYPTSIKGLILENPTFNLELSARSLLTAAALEFGTQSDRERASACLALAKSSQDARTIWNGFSDLTNELGDKRNNLYVYGPDKNFFERLVDQSPFPQALWGRGMVHQRRLYKEGRIFSSLIDSIGSVPNRALLLKGKYDHVFCGDQIHSFLVAKPETELVVFPESSHFVHVEEADRFATEVIRFVMAE